jgi:hypothetical protein
MQIRPRDPGIHYQLFIAYTRLRRTDEADRELKLFKQYDAEGKAKRGDGEEQIEDSLPRPPNTEKPDS